MYKARDLAFIETIIWNPHEHYLHFNRNLDALLDHIYIQACYLKQAYTKTIEVLTLIMY